MRRWIWVALGLIVIGIAPILSALLSSAIAGIAGCDLNEGIVTPCRIAGADLGGLLHTMFVAGWIALLSLPVAVAGALLLFGLGLVALIRRLR